MPQWGAPCSALRATFLHHSYLVTILPGFLLRSTSDGDLPLKLLGRLRCCCQLEALLDCLMQVRGGAGLPRGGERCKCWSDCPFIWGTD